MSALLEYVDTNLFAESLAGSAAWHRQALLSLVGGLCAAAYYLFWQSVLPYSHPPDTVGAAAHGLLATWLWGLRKGFSRPLCRKLRKRTLRKALNIR